MPPVSARICGVAPVRERDETRHGMPIQYREQGAWSIEVPDSLVSKPVASGRMG